ncbi:hypothetical protein [Bradyrhizobium sp. JYMT SZCCT0428]|uniref:hypothetical protein n=1 Tax=Bradyrhizobium sp. JYMT SZCCT0428 TaxID=2807673 RepID=UPI001BAC9BED|nr:hypothetical protein [Bradyrhizobium sp. JYMT SZCCT0428]MBR1154033.1 hypothetical protein [Bradyrhizobium sp. JYMT SZCCT0428]
MNEPLQGYVRTNVPLRILGTAIQKSPGAPSEGFLEISTEDGVLRLSISSDAARDLQIDLDQFIGEK